MWKWLHPYAKPERAYQLAGTLLPWFAVISLLSFVIGTVWGLAFAPADYQQGDSFRIIYIHVPSAILSMGAYSTMAVAAFIGVPAWTPGPLPETTDEHYVTSADYEAAVEAYLERMKRSMKPKKK